MNSSISTQIRHYATSYPPLIRVEAADVEGAGSLVQALIAFFDAEDISLDSATMHVHVQPHCDSSEALVRVLDTVEAWLAREGRPSTVIHVEGRSYRVNATQEALSSVSAIASKQAAQQQFLFRAVNERIAELSASCPYAGAKLFVCECSRIECADALELTLDQYETVRADGARFIVVDGHQLEQVERVVDRHTRYVVVEKLGEAGALARADNARRR